MAARPKRPATAEREPTLIWERAEPASRPSLEPLSRERIVKAALALADTDGLEAVSLRKVGAFLDAGPMRLYGYLSTKEELLELMVDAVYGEMAIADPVAADFRDALRSLARRMRQVAHAHPWFINLLSGRPHQGPNALAFFEASFAALSKAPAFADIDLAMQALRAVNAYVIGALHNEASELSAELASSMNKTEWQEATSPYLFRMLETGRFPELSRVVRDAQHPSPDVIFEQGLTYLLDGIGAHLPRTTGASD